jgi:integrase
MRRLSAKFVETVRDVGRYGDGAGLCLVVGPNQKKKWVLRYQRDGRRRDMGLGAFPDVSLSTARELAIDARRTVAAGGDPIANRRAKRGAKLVPTFREVAAEVIELEQAKSTNLKVRYQWTLLLGESYCAPLLGMPADSITTRDVERVLRPVWTSKPETARKLHRRIKRVLEHARVRLRDEHGVILAGNAANWGDLKALGFTPPKKLSRGPQPALDYRQAGQLLTALRDRDTTSARALEFLLLTAVRTDAVRRAEWREFDFGAAVWTIPIEHLKDKLIRTEPFRVPLAPLVLSRLHRWHEGHLGGLFVFPTPNGSAPISNMAMLTALKKMNQNHDGSPIWTDPRDGRAIVPHGFRASFRTWADEQTHYPRVVMEEALGHRIGTDVERAYRRTDVLEKRRSLMIDWSANCQA